MIICIEGPRNVGKTHLLRKFYESSVAQELDIFAYKFKMVDYVSLLPNLKGLEQEPAFHYFNLSSFFSLLQIGKDQTDKLVIGDRGLISSFIWSEIRQRTTEEIMEQELLSICQSEFYQKCHTIYIQRSKNVKWVSKEKDWWSQFEDYEEELQLFDKWTSQAMTILPSHFHVLENDFTQESEQEFIGLMYEIWRRYQ